MRPLHRLHRHKPHVRLSCCCTDCLRIIGVILADLANTPARTRRDDAHRVPLVASVPTPSGAPHRRPPSPPQTALASPSSAAADHVAALCASPSSHPPLPHVPPSPALPNPDRQ